jgi:hypothetical protein
MEEWDARLCVQKEKISAVDRLVEKNTLEQKQRLSTAEGNITGPKNKGRNSRQNSIQNMSICLC